MSSIVPAFLIIEDECGEQMALISCVVEGNAGEVIRSVALVVTVSVDVAVGRDAKQTPRTHAQPGTAPQPTPSWNRSQLATHEGLAENPMWVALNATYELMSAGRPIVFDVPEASWPLDVHTWLMHVITVGMGREISPLTPDISTVTAQSVVPGWHGVDVIVR